MEIRPAERDDAAAIRAVAEAAWYAAYAGFVDTDTIRQGIEQGYAAERIVDTMDREDQVFLVAEAEGEVVGFAAAEQTWADEATLQLLFVHPDRWGEGIGTALLDEIEARMADRGVEYLVASAFADNTVGPAFLAARGYEQVDTVQTEFGDEVHPEHVYEKALSADRTA